MDQHSKKGLFPVLNGTTIGGNRTIAELKAQSAMEEALDATRHAKEIKEAADQSVVDANEQVKQVQSEILNMQEAKLIAEEDTEKWLEELEKKELPEIKELKDGLTDLGAGKADYDSITGYANAQGGTLYIGIDDNGNVLGLEEKIVKKLLEDIPNKITAAFGMTCDVNLRTTDKKKYIQIEVKKSKLPLNLHGRYYYRTGSVKKEITGFELTEFIIKSTGTSYDDLVSFKLMQEDGQMTNAGILFADQWNIHHSRIFCTRWNGLEKANSTQDALDDAEYTGGLIELYDSTMAFIKNNTKKGWRKDNDKRVELPDYPERALEEGLVNALIHRSYL